MDWVGLDDGPLPVAEATTWAIRPDCGGVVTFIGTVRDHSEGREGVTFLEYEAYHDQVVPKLTALAAEARLRWPGLGRLALLHRLGSMGLGEASVLVAASAPHRDQAFDAARWCIDTLKTTVPIWKRESWSEGSDWATGASEVKALGDG
jgi:molybdopterin synthase catalytic subunit